MLSPQSIEGVSWMLDPEIAYLNHGSFGARPTEVFDAQVQLKREFERSPIKFLDREGKERVSQARRVISSFLGCRGANLGFVENATTGVACVIQSINLPAGSEIVSTNHVYNGIRQLLRAATNRKDLTYREIEIETPLSLPQDIVEQITESFTSSTKLLVIDHVASLTGIVFPVAELVSACKDRDIAILVDGAHAPGMLDLDIDALSPDWYVGNLHKWVCGPPGAGFLWVNDQHLDSTHPLTISHFYEQGFTNEFDWQGTRDLTSILGAAIAVQWGEKIGWDRIRKRNHKMALWMQDQLVEVWGTEPLSPLDGSMIGSMATVRLPDCFPTQREETDKLRDWIYEEYMVEIPILPWQGGSIVRASGQIYTKKEDIMRLINAVEASKRRFSRSGI
ncbi:aminotransferase class V-fold PLP-dependent enzyme [PVC group bacterium]|nr:aminotransferase class V-fold PLP-dependent enzyme [PVC group bacterium]